MKAIEEEMAWRKRRKLVIMAKMWRENQ
jgi:hypothetical protein